MLFRELLIGVTQFFRDPDAFAALQTALISAIVERKTADETVRIWVPACSTGEEAYSITVLLKEAMEKQGRTSKIQVFGTDLDESAVAFARSGRYRSANGISPEVLRRWFVEDADEVRPIRSVRDVCAFSIHSVIKDPPFSRVDLISCRNLLIYLNHDLQDKVLRTFEYSLNPGGVLFLGPSEGITRHGTQFVAINKKHSIFSAPTPPRFFRHCRPHGRIAISLLSVRPHRFRQTIPSRGALVARSKNILRFMSSWMGITIFCVSPEARLAVTLSRPPGPLVLSSLTTCKKLCDQSSELRCGERPPRRGR